jgi:hypothetical protein
MKKNLTFAVCLALLSPVAAAYDYPTVDRVEYVHACMRDNEGPKQEMVYKCSCVIDAIAKEMSYEDYVESSTAANAFSMGGERGEAFRSAESAKTMADKFKDLQSRAKKNCFIH